MAKQSSQLDGKAAARARRCPPQSKLRESPQKAPARARRYQRLGWGAAFAPRKAAAPATKGVAQRYPLQTVTRPRNQVGRLRPPEFARHAIEQALISNEGIHAVQHAHDLTKVL